MYKKNKILVIIPARGGSKGIFKKNIQQLGGRPLVEWSVLAAKYSKYVDCIHVSTDDFEISQISIGSGATNPFLRPIEISQDNSKTNEAILFSIESFEKLGYVFDLVIELQPTYPFRLNGLIDKCIEAYFEKDKINSLITIVKIETTQHKDFSISLNKNKLINFNKIPTEFRRQTLTPEFSCHGICICSNVKYLKKSGNTLDPNKTIGFLIDNKIIETDINDNFDLFYANSIIQFNQISIEDLKNVK